MSRLMRAVVALSSVAVFLLALWVLQRELKEYNLADIARAFHRIPWPAAAAAAVSTLLSYLALTGFDSLAVRYVGRDLPYPQVALASFVSQAISHSTGFAALTGTSIRYRLYSGSGLTGGEVARIVAFCALTFGLGAVAVVAGAMILEPHPVGVALKMPSYAVRGLGLALVAGLAAYTATTLRGGRQLRLWRWSVALPSWKMTAAQTFLAALDLALAAVALHMLLPGLGTPSFPAFLGLYAVAITAGVISHVPGGLGVFEGLMVLMMPQLPPSTVLAALAAYRLVYNLLPLVIAAVILAGAEVWLRARKMTATARWMTGAVEVLAPGVYACMALAGGAVLLWSGATPAITERLDFLETFVPLPVVEASHLLGSVVGLWLLLLARGLYRRLDGAYWLALALYGAGMALSLLKGFDWEEAGFLALLLVALAPCRRAFYRKASLIEQRFTIGWAAAVAVIAGGSVWLSLFAFKNHVYSRQMWWDFAFHSQAPRVLRASVAVVAIAGGWFLSRLLAPVRAKPQPPDPEQLETAAAIVAQSPSAEANIALLGDKSFLFDDNRQAFLMYAVSGRSWVALGDPVGPQDCWPDLIWRFREKVDQVSGWPVFYQVSPDALPFYLDLGLSFVKLGEEARVSLETFSLQGSARSELRYIQKRAGKEGSSFEVLPPEAVPALLPELRSISDDWLENKHTKEKRFSLGGFDEAYLARFPVAVVRRNGAIVAFANLWLSGGKEEAAVDLMRHTRDSGYGVMDYLFIESMLWAKAQGYHWFSFGVAPLSGMRDNALAPLWNRLGAFVYRHGEDLYNFQGLRRYKEKFQPIWSPRFMASPGGVVLPRVAADVATLISGGVKGLVMK